MLTHRSHRFAWLVVVAWGWCALNAPPAAHAEGLSARLVAVSEEALRLPHDMALTPDGRHLIVSDMGQNRVVALDAQTLVMRGEIGADEGMLFPHDVTFDNTGRLLVADTGNNRILLYQLHGLEAALVDVWTGLDTVQGVAAAPDGSVYVTLVEDNQVARLKGGHVTTTIDQALGLKLKQPRDVAVVETPEGTSVIVADSGNNRLIVFDADLNPLYGIFTQNPPLSKPNSISAGPDGTYFVADPYNDCIRVLSPAARMLGDLAASEVRLPQGVHVDGQRVWVADTQRGRIVLYLMDETH